MQTIVEGDSTLRVRLTWSDPSTGEQKEQIAALPFSIGRGADNTIVLSSGQVSRVHARLERDGGRVVIVDQNSTNGTIVNQQRTSKTALVDGDAFQIGPFQFNLDVEPFEDEPAPQLVTWVLKWEEPDGNGMHEMPIEPPVTIGREADNTIVVNSGKASRKHARIEREGEQLVLVDSGSSNGTYYNGERRDRVVLQPNDRIRIGDYTFQVVAPALAQGNATVIDTSSATVIDMANRTVIEDPSATRIEQGRSASLVFDDAGALRPAVPAPREAASAFPPACFSKDIVPVAELRKAGVLLEETAYLAVGGGLGSFSWVNHLVIFGVDPAKIVSIGLESNPYGRYERLCRQSQIPYHERLRSNSDSCPDNIWGWPGYAVREIWGSTKQGDLVSASKVAWQIFAEPALADTYTPRAGDVFRSIDREAERIGWSQIWRYGRVKAIRKTDDGRYVVAYSQTSEEEGKRDALMLANHVHIAVGYPGVRFLPDLQAYREETGDFKRVVNAYEEHEHVYQQLEKKGGTVMLRGRGIVASRILQRLYEARRKNPNIAVLHLLRTPLAQGNRFQRRRRKVEHHWEFQPFNWPKAGWGGDLRVMLERADPNTRDELLNDWGGTTTANRRDWKHMVNSGVAEGWYQIRFGNVSKVVCENERLVTHIRGKGAIEEESRLVADFIVDCTGLEATIETNPLLKDLVEHHGLPRNPKGRLHVENDFEIAGMRNGTGRMYAAGAMTLGGPYAPVDSFLGLQYAAQRSVDSLATLRAPGLRRLNGIGSLIQWTRWARGVKP